MRSRGRMLVLISTVWAQRTKRALTHALIGGAQPVEGWWAPVAQHTYKRRGGGQWHTVQRSSPFVPPIETLADQGCAEATGSATGPPSPLRHASVGPCATPPAPSRITPVLSSSSTYSGGPRPPRLRHGSRQRFLSSV